MIPCTKLSIKMQVKKATNFYKFSLDKNRVGNCDLFSRPVFKSSLVEGTLLNKTRILQISLVSKGSKYLKESIQLFCIGNQHLCVLDFVVHFVVQRSVVYYKGLDSIH